ncbi:hypothetical protein [Thalassomonas haliotis]|uniref:Uncharacterized protein n=1 Tax=Thalassomonas haliotis TaxID=485448 RepID=A0ABY7V8A7_9GAMM|nr:hypothetical protein [Thalassomonas haliotis]WDE09839.1 hypothetical protein H3N35_16105 [Thalassomonas haliotis]
MPTAAAEIHLVLFNISRIDTSLGIFRLTGHCCSKSCAPADLCVEKIEILGTDGWLVLALETDRVRDLIRDLAPELLAHLAKKEQVRQIAARPE